MEFSRDSSGNPRSSQEFSKKFRKSQEFLSPAHLPPAFLQLPCVFPASPGKTCLKTRGKSMAAPLKSAKGKSSTVSSPRDGFFAPFRARWRDRRAADLSLPTRPGNSARTWIPGGDPEAPPGPTLGNRGKSSFPLDFPQKTSKIPGISQTFQECFHKFLIFSQDSRKSQGFPRIP